MATKEMNLDEALAAIAKALEEDGGDFSQKAAACLDLLDAALGFFAEEGLLSRASVEVQMQTMEGRRYVRKYSLESKYSQGEERAYLKQSTLEEDE